MKILLSVLVAFLFFGFTLTILLALDPIASTERWIFCLIATPMAIAFGVQFYLQER
jgi:hypothetical protein